jgi:hypothetical protein
MKQIPRGNDRKKGKCNSSYTKNNCNCKNYAPSRARRRPLNCQRVEGEKKLR